MKRSKITLADHHEIGSAGWAIGFLLVRQFLMQYVTDGTRTDVNGTVPLSEEEFDIEFLDRMSILFQFTSRGNYWKKKFPHVAREMSACQKHADRFFYKMKRPFPQESMGDWEYFMRCSKRVLDTWVKIDRFRGMMCLDGLSPDASKEELYRHKKLNLAAPYLDNVVPIKSSDAVRLIEDLYDCVLEELDKIEERIREADEPKLLDQISRVLSGKIQVRFWAVQEIAYIFRECGGQEEKLLVCIDIPADSGKFSIDDAVALREPMGLLLIDNVTPLEEMALRNIKGRAKHETLIDRLIRLWVPKGKASAKMFEIALQQINIIEDESSDSLRRRIISLAEKLEGISSESRPRDICPRRILSNAEVTLVYRSGAKVLCSAKLSESTAYLVLEAKNTDGAYYIFDGHLCDKEVVDIRKCDFLRLVHCDKNNALVDDFLRS